MNRLSGGGKPSRSAAFSLVELLILLSVALVMVGLSVPVLRGLSLANNSESAIETLTRARDFQIKYKEKALASAGGAEARGGTWTELLRSGLSLEDARVLDGGAVLARHGYYFQMYFASKRGAPVANPADPLALRGRECGVDRFIIYAWPEANGRTGASAFVIDPSGMLRKNPPFKTLLYESKNLLHSYTGTEAFPPVDAAHEPDRDWSPASPVEAPAAAGKNAAGSGIRTHRGGDGDLWEAISIVRNY